jgi:hypothetical protein
MDSDDDGIPDYCDPDPNCPFELDQGDADGDGICNGLDACPCSSGDVNPVLTGDKDGLCGACDAPSGSVLENGGTCGQLCNSALSGIVYDNCPGLKTTSVRNDNEDSEQVHGAEVLGDECEPVPVPYFKAAYQQVSSTLLSTGGNGSWVSSTTQNTYRMTGLDTKFRGSVGRPGTASVGQESQTTVDQTQYRWCANINSTDVQIDCSSKSVVNEDYLHKPASRGAELKTTVWRRVWMKDTPKPDDVSNQNPFFGPYGYSRKKGWLTQLWNVGDDLAVWQAPPLELPVSLATPGRFWVNSNSAVGLSVSQDGHGLHKLPGGTPVGLIANHYETAVPLSISVTTTYHQIPRIQPAFPWTYCGSCVLERPLPDLNDCPTCVGVLPQQILSDPYEGQLVVRLPSGIGLPQSYGVLLHDGSFAPIEDRLSVDVRQALDTPGLLWAGHEEALPHLGLGGAMPSALALSSDGTSLVSQLAIRGHHFATVGTRLTGPGTGPISTVPGAALAAQQAAITPAPGDTPEPRSDFAAVYSRVEGRVFVVGGTDPVTHASLGTIWGRKIQGDAAWKRVPFSGYAPVKVVAVTYSYQDQRLWILDEVKQGFLKKVRLVRLDPATGEFEQIGSWLKLGLFNQHWLVLDKDGEVLLAASSDALKQHTLVRFDNHGGGWKLDRVVLGQGALAFKPMVDEAGYSLVINKKPQSAFHDTETKRMADLGGIKAQWGHLGACW